MSPNFEQLLIIDGGFSSRFSSVEMTERRAAGNYIVYHPYLISSPGSP